MIDPVVTINEGNKKSIGTHYKDSDGLGEKQSPPLAYNVCTLKYPNKNPNAFSHDSVAVV